MFKWIERKILRPIIKNPVESILAGAAIATMGPAAAGTIGKLSAGTKVALASSAASTAGAILTRSDAKKENTRVLAANKAESERVYEQNKKEVVESREYNTGVRENYYDNLVKDAQKAGINPLTALRAGGGSAYGNAVAGTMAQGVMMDGVYATPTLSRNPIAAGLETGVNVGLAEFTRQQNYSHESRMDELQKSLMKAQINSMNSELKRGKHDLPLLVNAYDPTGNLPDFLVPNPELLEFSWSEFKTSLGAIAASYALQNNISQREAEKILTQMWRHRNQNIQTKRKREDEISVTELKDPFLQRMGNVLDKLDMRMLP
jgi:hypothetical protein